LATETIKPAIHQKAGCARRVPLCSRRTSPSRSCPEELAWQIKSSSEEILVRLANVELFFQPGALHAICTLANDHDNPKKRKYTFGL